MVLLFAIVVVDDGALGLLVNLFVIYCETCDICDIYVVLLIYMCCWWYICDVGDVCYIYLLFVWMECKKQIKRLFSVTLLSAMAMTLGKVKTWEHAWEHALPSAKAIALGKHHKFAECHGPGTRQRSPVCRVSEPKALGKAATFAECLTLTLGKAAVKVALAVTATFLCRVPD